MEKNIINVTNERFTALAKTHKEVNFEQECHFAMQILKGNDYTMGIAKKNPDSLRMAIENVASIGISLNPALCHAYLVPRKGQICLDVGYRGMVHLGVKGGSVSWVKAELIYKSDNFILNGIGEKPSHSFNPLHSERVAPNHVENIVGVYAMAKIGNDYLVEFMTISQVYEIRNRSESWKAGKSSPWKSDPTEMIKKTVIKRGAKLWPKVERLNRAIEVINEHEGINFNEESAQFDENLIEIVTNLASQIDNGVTRITGLIERTFKVELENGIESFSVSHCRYAINFLKDFISKNAKKIEAPKEELKEVEKVEIIEKETRSLNKRKGANDVSFILES
jgi:recombination protein RecT